MKCYVSEWKTSITIIQTVRQLAPCVGRQDGGRGNRMDGVVRRPALSIGRCSSESRSRDQC